MAGKKKVAKKTVKQAAPAKKTPAKKQAAPKQAPAKAEAEAEAEAPAPAAAAKQAPAAAQQAPAAGESTSSRVRAYLTEHGLDVPAKQVAEDLGLDASKRTIGLINNVKSGERKKAGGGGAPAKQAARKQAPAGDTLAITRQIAEILSRLPAADRRAVLETLLALI
jgi:hypothetical protein